MRITVKDTKIGVAHMMEYNTTVDGAQVMRASEDS